MQVNAPDQRAISLSNRRTLEDKDDVKTLGLQYCRFGIWYQVVIVY